MTVLVNGGAGYIGAHVVRLLQERDIDVVVVDDLSTGAADRVGDAPLYQFDLARDQAPDTLTDICQRHHVTSIIHFAAKKQVGESVEKPAWYYQQNIGSLANVLTAMERADVRDIVFSSSASVYGTPDADILTEDMPHTPINPYGETKFVGEWMLDDAARAFGAHVAKLRYFNVAGSGWDDLGDPAIMNLIPMVFDRLARNQAPAIFGTDYPTPDGTCVRDYIHVYDLADAHVAALSYLEGADRPYSAFNVGTGTGYSVREVVDEIDRVTGNTLAAVLKDRRAGDPPRLVADSSRIGDAMNWHAKLGLSDIVESAWSAWQHDHPETDK